MHKQSALLHEDALVQTLMDSLPCGVMILDRRARVVSVNKALEKIVGPIDHVAGKGAGQSIGCLWSLSQANGCGHAEWCSDCEMRRMTLTVINQKKAVNEKAAMDLLIDGCAKQVTLHLNIAPLSVHNKRYAIMTIVDIRPLQPAPSVYSESGFHHIVGTDPKMQAIFDAIRKVAATDAAVLIQGESGTGKELVATAIHKESRRQGRPFVPCNCGALTKGMVESELFGHVKGAFTSAIKDKKGRFELAHTGTLFLDEVGELPPSTQVKLLRVLQDGTFERVGAEKSNQADVRIISATNKNLEREVDAGRFRRDLYYRLCVVPIVLPPLRDRKGDIPLLVDHLIKLYADTDSDRRIEMASRTLKTLTAYHWPGNVRELQNVIQFALINNQGARLKRRHLPPHLNYSAALQSPVKKRRKLDRHAVAKALAQTNGNKKDAAKLLGVSRSTLYRFFSQHGSFSDHQV
jgi:transcriptional regulator with PAS, ATPase and Fis domain